MSIKSQDSQDQNDTKGDESDKILHEARERLLLSAEAENSNRIQALEDLNFRAGDQWAADIKNKRDKEKRPCLTINRIPQFIKQVTNEQRQNRPAIKVSPVDDQGDVETAKVIQGLIRHIEYDSNADVAYDTAFEGAVVGGFGYFRVITDYCDPMSFEQEILIKRIRNPFSVYLDPSSTEPDGSDINWALITEDLTKEEYQVKYPKSKLSSLDLSSIGDEMSAWAGEDTYRVAEYFVKEFKEVELVLLNNKQVIEKSKLPEALPEGISVVQTRSSQIPTIKWYKINGVEILEQTDWPGQWIPIIPVIGDEIDINGKRILEGIVRHAKDPQKMYNIWASSETETIALAPRSPFIMAAGQITGFEKHWQTANTESHAVLLYNEKSINGQPIAPPQRNVYEPPVQAITQARMQASEDLKATTGIYDAALGNRSNETSGIAIQKRNNQTQTSNFHFVDNLTRSLRHAGRIIVDLIPHIYDTARAVRIIGEDGEHDIAQINQIFQENGKDKVHNLSLGKYDVTIDTGPSYATKRQDAVQSMLSFIQAYPPAAQVSGDLLVKNMDWNGAQEIAERLKKTLPPGIAEPENGQAPPLPPQVKQQMDQMSNMIQQLSKQYHAAQDIIDQKKVEIESRERIAFAQIEADLQKTLLTNNSKEAITGFVQEINHIHKRLDLLNIDQPIENEGNEPDQNGPANQPPGGPSPGQSTGGQPPGQPTGGLPPGDSIGAPNANPS